MGMFRTPYDRGGVLSKEAMQERAERYLDMRERESAKQENRLIAIRYLLLWPFALLPGFLPWVAVAHTALLLLPYALELVCMLLTGITLVGFVQNATGSVNGRLYKQLFTGLQMRAALAGLFGALFFLAQLLCMLLHRSARTLSEGLVLLMQSLFLLTFVLFFRQTDRVIRNWRLTDL